LFWVCLGATGEDNARMPSTRSYYPRIVFAS